MPAGTFNAAPCAPRLAMRPGNVAAALPALAGNANCPMVDRPDTAAGTAAASGSTPARVKSPCRSAATRKPAGMPVTAPSRSAFNTAGRAEEISRVAPNADFAAAPSGPPCARSPTILPSWGAMPIAALPTGPAVSSGFRAFDSMALMLGWTNTSP